MKRLFLYLALTFVSSAQSPRSDVVARWFPVHVDDKWIYSYESKNDKGDRSLRIEHRETEETTTGVWAVSEGTLGGRHSVVMSGHPPPEYWTVGPDRDRAYLIRGNCLYLRWSEWDPIRRQLKQSYHNDLFAGRLAADFCVPLVIGKTWCAQHFGDWRVPPDASEKGSAFHVMSVGPYPGSGITAAIWFDKGVGVVREEEIHHGTIREVCTQLVRFEPAAKK
jgi:hypothetical protein